MLHSRPGQKSAHSYVPRHRAERAPLVPVSSTALRRGLVGSIAGLALTGGAIAPTYAASSDADRAPDGMSSASMSKDRLPDISSVGTVLRIAASKAGTPYSYGATGPNAFDCSGFTQWVFARAGKSLPRTSAAQAGAVRRVSAGDARPGDLVFFTGGGRVYHVGIYAGGNAVWHSPRPGEGVQRSQIWTSSIFFGRP